MHVLWKYRYTMYLLHVYMFKGHRKEFYGLYYFVAMQYILHGFVVMHACCTGYNSGGTECTLVHPTIKFFCHSVTECTHIVQVVLELAQRN